jgi:hypothetical protein
VWTSCMLTWLPWLFVVVCPLLETLGFISFLFLGEGEFSLRDLCPHIVTLSTIV